MGTVYRHFPNKQALFEAVVFDRLQSLIGEARSLLGAGDPGGVFFGFFSRAVVEGVAKKDLVNALAGEGVEVVGTTAGVPTRPIEWCPS